MRLLIGKMGSDRRWFLGFLGLLISVLTTGVPGHAQASARARWDIITVDFSTTPPTANAGGMATALANDGSMPGCSSADCSKITLTGTGFFRKLPAVTRFSAIAKEGGGTWETFDPTGASTGKGNYTVRKGPATFIDVAGSFTAADLTDLNGDIADLRAGMLVLDIRYDDGHRGVLVVSCKLKGSPATNFEGITVTKGSKEYWLAAPPVKAVDGNRTAFHVIH